MPQIPFKFVEDLPRSIVAHAIGDQDFHLDPAKFLAKNGIEKRVNVPNFIPAGDHHRDDEPHWLCGMDFPFLAGTSGQKINHFQRTRKGGRQ